MTGLDHETPPPPHLKRRVIATLQERELLRGGHRWSQLIRTAAAIVLVASGFWTARLMSAAEEPVGPRWLVLLYEDSTFTPQATIPELVAEYSSWADSLRERHQLVAGEKLGSGALVLGGPALERSSLGELAGFFIVTADDEVEANEIARSCPHLRHGGRVVLRPIERTD